jgi:hypothetical protein
MTTRKRRRERLSNLNKQGHAPKLSNTLSSESGNGYILTWNTTSESFDLSQNTGGTDEKQAPNIILSDTTVVYKEDSIVVRNLFPFNPNDYESSATFKLQASISLPLGGEANVKLYNMDNKEYVTSAAIQATSTGPTMYSSTITVGGSAGELRNEARNYELRLDVQLEVGGVGSRYGVFSFVGMRVIV